MKLLLVISYDGSKFNGFQRQKREVSVQKELERALTKIMGEDILVKGAGRTDRGVHAKRQVVHFECPKKVKHLKKVLNKELENITIKKVKKVSSSFHARYSVKEKEYLYKIDLSGKRDPRYYLINKNHLDIKMMKDAKEIFLGTHSFKNFTAGFRDDYTTTISKIKIWEFNKVLYIKFIGHSFYRYMVRNLVGALIEVGKGKVNKKTLKDMLDEKTDKRLLTVSPNGLYLIKIKY